MSTRPPAPRPRGRGAQAEGGRRHTTLGTQETRSRGGRRRNGPAPSAVGGDKGQRYIFPFGPVGAGRLDAAPNRYATLSSKRPTPTNPKAKEPRPTAESRAGFPARRRTCEHDDTRACEPAAAMRAGVLRRAPERTTTCAVSYPPRLRKAGRGWETESQRGGGVAADPTKACAVSYPPRLRKAGRGWETTPSIRRQTPVTPKRSEYPPYPTPVTQTASPALPRRGNRHGRAPKGAAGRNAHGGARAERTRHHAPPTTPAPGGAEGAEARGVTGAGGARTTARDSTRTAGATAQRAGGARREPQPTEEAGARPHRRPNAGRTTATPAPAEARPCAEGGRAGAARRAPRGRTAGRGGPPAPPPRPAGAGRGGGAESLGGRGGWGMRAAGAGRQWRHAGHPPPVSQLPNLHRYGRRHKASNPGVAEFTTVILYGSRRPICLPSLLT